MPASFSRLARSACAGIASDTQPGRQGSLFAEDDDPDPGRTQEIDPDFLEFVRREEIDEPEPVWEP